MLGEKAEALGVERLAVWLMKRIEGRWPTDPGLWRVWEVLAPYRCPSWPPVLDGVEVSPMVAPEPPGGGGSLVIPDAPFSLRAGCPMLG